MAKKRARKTLPRLAEKLVAQYKCWNCNYLWTGKPGPIASEITKRAHCQKCDEEYEEDPGFCNHTHCFKCGSYRCDWLNWKEIVKRVRERRFNHGRHRNKKDQS